MSKDKRIERFSTQDQKLLLERVSFIIKNEERVSDIKKSITRLLEDKNYEQDKDAQNEDLIVIDFGDEKEKEERTSLLRNLRNLVKEGKINETPHIRSELTRELLKKENISISTKMVMLIDCYDVGLTSNLQKSMHAILNAENDEIITYTDLKAKKNGDDDKVKDKIKKILSDYNKHEKYTSNLKAAFSNISTYMSEYEDDFETLYDIAEGNEPDTEEEYANEEFESEEEIPAKSVNPKSASSASKSKKNKSNGRK